MQHDLTYTRFAVKAFPAKGSRPRELTRTMAPHPLSFQELPFDPEYTLYNNRLTPEYLNCITDDEMYWAVRTGVILRHTGELPIEISGPDAEVLLNRVFTRDISKVKPGRCSYHFACYHDGGMITDGVLLRLAQDRFWMAQADGDLFSWYKSQAKGLRVWGTPTTAMWVYRLGPEKAKRMLFTGDKINGKEAEAMGLVLKSVPTAEFDTEVEAMAQRMATVPINQLAMQKMVINQAMETTITQTQRLATVFDGISRHSPEGLNFKARSESEGWKQAVKERDQGLYDWTQDKPLNG